MWIGIAASVLLLALALFIIINQRVQNQKLRFRQQQQESNQEIFNLMLAQKQKVEEGKQSVQRRISEELHDGVLGQMNGIRMVLLGLNKKTEDDAVDMRSKAIEKLQTVQEEIRTISHQLSDAAYQKFHNFMHSIDDLIKSVEITADAAITYHYEEHIDWDELSADIQINVYRIVQECLMNCIKHAQANNISLAFDGSGNELLITLTDDGKGFDTSKGKKGIGHKNISSRVMKVNGSWAINSTIGKGTQIIIRIPYHTSRDDKRMDAEIKSLLNQD
jgi:signal transduction histidine kinase